MLFLVTANWCWLSLIRCHPMFALLGKSVTEQTQKIPSQESNLAF